VHVDDAIDLALVIIDRRRDQCAIEADQQQQRRDGQEPGRPLPREAVEIGWRSEAMEPGPGHNLRFYSMLMRTAAAAASGARVRASTPIAASPNIALAVSSPEIDHTVARAPNTSTGITSGSTS